MIWGRTKKEEKGEKEEKEERREPTADFVAPMADLDMAGHRDPQLAWIWLATDIHG